MKNSTKRTIRTVLQTLIGLAAAMPLIVNASGLTEASPGVALALAVSAGITRVMALPAVDNLLPTWLSMRKPLPPE